VPTVYWLLQRASDVPEADDWLSPAERDVLARFQVRKRRRDWRLGRWTAKRALVLAGAMAQSGVDPVSLLRLSIEPTDAGVPLARMDGKPAGWTISLSHSGENGLCVVTAGCVALGCDIETVGRHGEALVVDYFTASERAQVLDAEGEDRSRRVTLIWSAKESALKALGTGLRTDTRDVDVALGAESRSGGTWQPLTVRTASSLLEGWWQAVGECVMTLVADPPPNEPECL
jgi:4'-phosphopantetheinyl transferase